MFADLLTLFLNYKQSKISSCAILLVMKTSNTFIFCSTFARIQRLVIFQVYLFCVLCAHHQPGPWIPAFLEPGDDDPEKCVSVCQWSFSRHPAQTGLLTWAGAPEMKPSYLQGVSCCLCCGPPEYDPAPDREEAQGEEVGLRQGETTTDVLRNFPHRLFKMCFQLLPHRLHQHLSGGVLCPGCGVCVWVWLPSGGPSCVCRLCCHLLRMDCWVEACGTSLYLQKGHRTTGQLVNKDMGEPTCRL